MCCRLLISSSLGAWITMVVEPRMLSTQPSLPCRFNRSVRKYDDSTALKPPTTSRQCLISQGSSLGTSVSQGSLAWKTHFFHTTAHPHHQHNKPHLVFLVSRISLLLVVPLSFFNHNFLCCFSNFECALLIVHSLGSLDISLVC